MDTPMDLDQLPAINKETLRADGAKNLKFARLDRIPHLNPDWQFVLRLWDEDGRLYTLDSHIHQLVSIANSVQLHQPAPGAESLAVLHRIETLLTTLVEYIEDNADTRKV